MEEIIRDNGITMCVVVVGWWRQGEMHVSSPYKLQIYGLHLQHPPETIRKFVVILDIFRSHVGHPTESI